MKQLVLAHDFHHPPNTIYQVLSRPWRHWQFLPMCRKSDVVSRVVEPDGQEVVAVNYVLASKKHNISHELGVQLRLNRLQFEITVCGIGENTLGISGTSRLQLERLPKGSCRLTFTIRYETSRWRSKLVPVAPMIRFGFGRVMRAVSQFADLVASADKSLDPAHRRRRRKLMAQAEADKVSARESVLKRLPRHSVGAEIGVFAGVFAEQIIKAVDPVEFHLIDPWKALHNQSHAESWYGEMTQDYMDALHVMVSQALDNEMRSGVVKIHRDFSANVLPGFADNHFDWIYIDGDHAYEAVAHDLEASFAKVRPGGLIAGDDYRVAGWWGDGVVRAVDEFVARRPVEMIHTQQDQFVIRKRD